MLNVIDDFEEKETVASKLENGTAVRRFCIRRRPEQGKIKIRRETGHIIWHGSQTGKELISKSIN